MDIELAKRIEKACRAYGLIAETGSGYPYAGPGDFSYMVATSAKMNVILAAIIAHADMFVVDGEPIFDMMESVRVDSLMEEHGGEQHHLLHILF